MSAVRLLTTVLAMLLVAPAAAGPACPAGKVSVKSGKRTSCKPLATALPAPAEGDARLTLLRAAVGFSWKGARDRRGHRSPTMKKLFRRVSPKALKLLKRNLPRAVGLYRPRATRASGGCAASEPGSFSEKGPGGLSLGVSMSTSTLEATVENKDKRVELSFDLCRMTQSYDVPACPTTDGQVNAKSTYQGTIATSLLVDGKVKQKVTVGLDADTEYKGRTADDAKLDRLDIVDVLELKVSSPGSGVIVGASRVSGFFKRRASVDMRSGQYTRTDDGTILDASLGGIAGLLVGDEFRRNATRQLKQAADNIFSDLVARAIEKYRARESGWQTPEACVETSFDPAAGTLRLRRDQTGSFKARLKAKADGGAPTGVWTLAGATFATVTLGTATAAEPSFGYTVLDAGDGKVVSAVLRATSKAGVGQKAWTQPTEADEAGYFYKVLSAKLNDHLNASDHNPDSGCGLSGISPDVDETVDISLGEQPYDGTNRLEDDGQGNLTGSISARGDGMRSGTLHGCDISTEPPWPACTETFSSPFNGGPAAYIKANPRTGTAVLNWPMPPLSATNGVNTCRGGNFTGQDPDTFPEQTIDFAILASSAPQTLSLQRSRSAPSGPQATVSSTVTLEITIQRVREDGSPL